MKENSDDVIVSSTSILSRDPSIASTRSALSSRISSRRQRTDYHAFRRPPWAANPMESRRRRRLALRRLFCRIRDSGEGTPSTAQPPDQYRIPRKGETAIWWRPVSFLLERHIMRYTIWNYQTSFSRSIVSFFIIFFMIMHIFTFVLYGFAYGHYRKLDEDCLTGWSTTSPFELSSNFAVVFSASWTTMTTVGYGTVSPPDDTACQLVRYTLAIEAFVGLVYFSFCGAILFTKMVRVEASANVEFSSVMCLQYGEGVTDTRLDVVHSVTELVRSSRATPYPVIEIRLVNMEGSVPNGEIVDASIKCVVTSLRLINENALDSPDEGGLEHESDAGDSCGTVIDDEGSVQVGTASSVHRFGIKRTYQEMKVTPRVHPYFSVGPLYCRHVLDEHSPLLTTAIQKRIRDSGGWPSDMNDAAKVRDCLSKNVYEITVTFKGTSNFTADSIFKMHSYRRSDIYIGWSFAKLGYVSRSNRDDEEPVVKMDLSLTHDIVPQRGGGSSPLGTRKPDPSVMSFLASSIALDD